MKNPLIYLNKAAKIFLEPKYRCSCGFKTPFNVSRCWSCGQTVLHRTR